MQREDDPFYKLEHDTGNIAKAKASAPSIACGPARARTRLRPRRCTLQARAPRCNGLPNLPASGISVAAHICAGTGHGCVRHARRAQPRPQSSLAGGEGPEGRGGTGRV